MTDANLSNVDLNLLVVVHAVLEERSATRAASRLHLTQPAVSNALRRARDAFGDPLVVRSGRGFAVTPHGRALLPRIASILGEVREALGSARFDPWTTERRFTIGCADLVDVTLVPAILARLAARMPHATLRTVSLERVARDGLGDGVDALIGIPPVTPPSCTRQRLYDERMVCVVRAGHPQVRRRLGLATYAALPHVELALFGEPEDRVDRALAAVGRARTIRATTPSIAALPAIVAATDCVATVAESVARLYAGPLGLRVLKPPVRFEPLTLSLIWHDKDDADPGGQAFREVVVEAVRERGGGGHGAR